VLYIILIQFGMELVQLTKCLNETYSKVSVHAFPIQNGLKFMLYHHCISFLLQNTHVGKSKKIGRDWN